MFIGYGFRLGTFGIIWSALFLFIMGTIIVTVVKGIAQWVKNNNSPRMTLTSVLVTKRNHSSRHRGANGHRHTTTSYYATFQLESGERIELRVSGEEYGMLVEGDIGYLTFQGTRYLGFERM